MNDENYYYDVEHPEHPEHPGSGNRAAQPDGYMNLGLFTFLMIITAGIYSIYLYYKFTKLTNEDQMLPQRTPWAQLLLCLFVPFYRWYWFYMTSLRMDNLVRNKQGIVGQTFLTNLLLSIFGLDMIAFIVLQNSYNKSVGGATGKSPNSTGYGHCKNCGHEFPDDYVSCPYCNTPYKKPFYRKPGFCIAMVIIVMILVFSLLFAYIPGGSSQESVDSSQYEYSYSVTEPYSGTEGPQQGEPGESSATTETVPFVNA